MLQYLQNIHEGSLYSRNCSGFDDRATRRDYYFKTRNAAREFRLRINRWKAEQKYPSDVSSFDDADERWLAYLRAHVGNLELLPAIVTHWERTAKPITRPLKVEELCKAFVLYREGKGLDKATLSENRYISRRLQKHLGGYMAHELRVAGVPAVRLQKFTLSCPLNGSLGNFSPKNCQNGHLQPVVA